jgi:uncharacterized protein (DUF1810 family)
MLEENTLDRFVEAQTLSYQTALGEIRRGAKRSHWMWYVFPQLAGLGRSETARHFAIASLNEAREYLEHPVLGARYRERVGALQDLSTSDPVEVFGDIDAIKLRSSLTLFESARPMPILAAALDRWFGGERDTETIELLGQEARAAK